MTEPLPIPRARPGESVEEWIERVRLEGRERLKARRKQRKQPRGQTNG